MPTVHRESGFEFRINTDDHAPAHVHVWYQGSLAVIEFELQVAEREVYGTITMAQRRRAIRIVRENRPLLLATTSSFSKQDEDIPRKQGLMRMNAALMARHASFEKATASLRVELCNGVILSVPRRLIQILKNATMAEASDVELLLDGLFLRWPRLDEDLKVQSLVEGTFGTARWMEGISEHLAELGRQGGRSRSKSKTEAARINGAKGGRPKRIRANA